jgi:hypothetical protein
MKHSRDAAAAKEQWRGRPWSTTLALTVLLALVACSSSDDGARSDDSASSDKAAPAMQTEATVDPMEVAEEARAAVEAIAGQVGSPDCELDEGARRVDEILAWFESSGEEAIVAGRDREAWNIYRDELKSASEAAAEPAAFAAFWAERGGSTDPHGSAELGARLASGEEAAIGELDPDQPIAYASMLASALHSAMKRDDRVAMTRLVDALLAADVGPRYRVGAAAYLLLLDQDAEAQAILDAHAGTGEPVALGGIEASMFLMRFIEAEGMEAAFERMRQLFGDSALEFAIAAAPNEYERRDDDDGLAAFLSSPVVLEQLGRGKRALILAPTTVRVIEVHGEDVGLDVIEKQAELILESNPRPALQLARLTRDLAAAGCSDTCLGIPLAAIESIMGDTDNSESLRAQYTQALAAAGALDQALDGRTEPGQLVQFAISYAVGRRDPAYVDPLLAQLEGSERIEAGSQLAAELFWRDAPLDAIARALSRRPADSPPDMWLNMLAGSAVHYDRAEPESQALRETLVGWSLGLCSISE